MAGEVRTPSIERNEHDPSSPETKKVLLYGWTGSAKVRVGVDASGNVNTNAVITPSGQQSVVQASAASLNATVVFGAAANVQVVQASAGSLNATVTISGTPSVNVSSLATLPVGSNMIGQVNVSSLVSLPAGTNVIGALTANQSVNVAQVAGVATSVGNGVSGTGVQRVTIASDSTGQIIALGNVASGAADSGNPIKIGTKSSATIPTAVTAGQRVDGWSDLHGNIHVRDGIQTAAGTVWTQTHVPVANTVATKSQAAGAAGVRNVCTGLTVVLAATATAPTAVNVTVNLIDGATGGTTYLWRSTLSLPATAGETRGITRSGLWIPGTAATAMTLEFSAAGGANTIESVSFEGVTITE